MKNKNVMIEVLFVTIAGIITIGLSINSIIESKTNEKRLNKKQSRGLFN